MNGHPQYEEDFELYELGVLSGGDRAEFEAHLFACPECRVKLATAQSFVARLALAAPASDPAPVVRDRILQSFRMRPSDPEEAAAPAPVRRGVSKPVWAWVCAAACLVLLVATVWLGHDNGRLSKRAAELERSRKELQASSVEMQAEAARAQAVLEVLTSAQTVQVELSPSAVHPVPHGKAFYSRGRGLLFYTTNLNALPSNRTYELWLIPTAGKPADLGIFNTDRQGNGQVILPPLPQGLTAKAFAVTVEPAGGTPAPTGPIVLVGPVS